MDAFRSLRELWVRMSNTGSACQAPPPSNMRAPFVNPHPTPCFPPQCRRGYLQFLVDSKVVYEALEEACGSDPRLAEFRNTGLERTEALTKVRTRRAGWLCEVVRFCLVVRFWVPWDTSGTRASRANGGVDKDRVWSKAHGRGWVYCFRCGVGALVRGMLPERTCLERTGAFHEVLFVWDG